MPSSAHITFSHLTSRAGTAKRTQTEAAPAHPGCRALGTLCHPQLQGPQRSPQGLHLKAWLPHPGSVRHGVRGAQSDDMFKGTETVSKKNEV